ncbi:MAG: 50S ribosomal protein L7/L12 [Candidatus Parcubacteria bacterium]|nr:50S ribosomal protein L7/L12 [Candidatus Parcubacteria bacterium]
MEEEKVEVPAKFKDLVEKIETMSVLELHELVKLLEKRFGVSAAAVAVAGAVAPSAEAADEKSSFNVELTAIGDQKIGVIKVIKEILGLGLKEAKDLVEAAPSMVKEGLKKDEAEAMKKKLEEVGAKVTLK